VQSARRTGGGAAWHSGGGADHRPVHSEREGNCIDRGIAGLPVRRDRPSDRGEHRRRAESEGGADARHDRADPLISRLDLTFSIRTHGAWTCTLRSHEGVRGREDPLALAGIGLVTLLAMPAVLRRASISLATTIVAHVGQLAHSFEWGRRRTQHTAAECPPLTRR
jgi:hypothetical protein